MKKRLLPLIALVSLPLFLSAEPGGAYQYGEAFLIVGVLLLLLVSFFITALILTGRYFFKSKRGEPKSKNLQMGGWIMAPFTTFGALYWGFVAYVSIMEPPGLIGFAAFAFVMFLVGMLPLGFMIAAERKFAKTAEKANQ